MSHEPYRNNTQEYLSSKNTIVYGLKIYGLYDWPEYLDLFSKTTDLTLDDINRNYAELKSNIKEKILVIKSYNNGEVKVGDIIIIEDPNDFTITNETYIFFLNNVDGLYESESCDVAAFWNVPDDERKDLILNDTKSLIDRLLKRSLMVCAPPKEERVIETRSIKDKNK